MNLDTILLYHSGELDTEESRTVELELQKPENQEFRDFYQALLDQQNLLRPDELLDTESLHEVHLDVTSIIEQAQGNTVEKKQGESKKFLSFPIISGLSITAAAAACAIFMLKPAPPTQSEITSNAPPAPEEKLTISQHLEIQKNKRFKTNTKSIVTSRGPRNITQPKITLAKFKHKAK